MTLAGVELICGVFVVIFLIGQLLDTEKTKTLFYVKLLCIFTSAWLLIDCLALYLDGPDTASWILWSLNFITFLMRPVFLLLVTLFADSFVVERGKCSKWWFAAPKIIALCGIVFSIIYFILGNVGSIQNGEFSFREKIPAITLYFYIGFILYIDAIAISLHKRIGLRPGLIVTLSFVPVIVAVFILNFFDIDLTLIAISIFISLVCGALQRKNIENKVVGKILANNNEQILALEDNFELLYDVDLNTFNYNSFAKGQSDSENIKSSLVNINNFFSDSETNAKTYVHPEDSQRLK